MIFFIINLCAKVTFVSYLIERSSDIRQKVSFKKREKNNKLSWNLNKNEQWNGANNENKTQHI